MCMFISYKILYVHVCLSLDSASVLVLTMYVYTSQNNLLGVAIVPDPCMFHVCLTVVMS